MGTDAEKTVLKYILTHWNNPMKQFLITIALSFLAPQLVVAEPNDFTPGDYDFTPGDKDKPYDYTPADKNKPNDFKPSDYDFTPGDKDKPYDYRPANPDK
jgi:hypothetical protein